MIYATVNMTIGDYSSTCDNKILLYRGDKNVEIRIVMKGNKFTVLDSTYAQMIIKRPSATSVFSEPAPIQNDTVVFVITEDMIDELKEIGEYTFQVRLYDDTMAARATLPPCNSALIIERPIAVEGEATVNLAMVNDSAVMPAADIDEEEIFTEDNKYNRTIWKDGDLITDVRLNKIEDALYYINENGGNGSGGGATAPYISTELPETVMVGSDENFDLNLYFNSPNMGKGTLRVFINDVDAMNMKIDQGDITAVIPGNLFTKGTNRVVVYVLDRVGVMSNSLVFYIRYGSTEISSDFDPYSAYDYGATIRYYFTPTAIDTSLSLTFYMSIDGQVQQGVNCTSDTRGYYTFPSNLSADSHYCEAYIVDSKGVKSNVLSFNLIILDSDTLVVASDSKEVSVEEGEQLSLDYKVYMKNSTSFITKVYIDDNLVNTGTCNADFNYYKTSSLTEGIHTIKLEVWDFTETYNDYITWTITVTPSTYEMLQPVNAGAMFIGTALNKTNTDERKQYFIGHDQEGDEVLGTLSNFAYNSESGWVNDELIISGNSHVEIPIQPLANNAKYGFTLDIEFTSKQIGVPDAEVLTLWNDETNCGIKITTEKLILQSSNGNKCDLYFTDNEKIHVMFVIDRQELKAKIYLNGVMCEAFHLNDYTVDGVAYLDDFTVNSNIILGGLNTNGYCKIRNLRVYQVALTTDEIMNNFISCEIDKAKQRELSEFQKGNDLPTLYVYCDFSGLGKDDKKPCKIVYNSTNEELYGKSFNLDHKQSQLQYQGTSSMAYPIKNYRLNLRDENGDKWYYTLPTAQPECRFTLKADFMSSGHWTNTGMAKFINDKLYNYNVNDEKSMNPFKWNHIQNGGKVTDFRETITGFPCRLILVNDGETPLNTGQNEPTPGNTKDMGIFNFNNDKDNVTTLGFNSDIFPNCASYEVTANSDTSAGAFMSFTPNIVMNSDSTSRSFLYMSTIGLSDGDSVTVVNTSSTATREVELYYNPTEDGDGIQNNGTGTWKSKHYINPGESITFTISESVGNCVQLKYTGDIEAPFIINGITIYQQPNPEGDHLTLIEVISSNFDELGYLKESFELRHPDKDDVAEDWGFMGIPGEEGTGLKALIDWVDNCTDEEFVRDFEEHFHKDYTLRYFCLVTLIGAVDNLGKNMMLDTADSKIFFPRFYDIDTICSYDNSGQLKFDVDIEMEQGYWNTSSSRLWTRIRDLMHNDIVTTYNNMRQNGVSYENMMHYIYDEQIAKIPQTYYNKDYDVKYAPFADSYIGMAHGDTYEHVKRWLKQRFAFVDTLFDYAPSYNNDVLTIRVNTTEEITLHLETYTPVYQHLSWYNGQMDKKKIDGKTSITFSGKVQAATDQEVLIYGGSNIKKITGIQSGNPNRLILGSATKLTELDASNCPLLAEINMNKANLSPHEYLNKVNLSNCPLLEGNLRLNNSPLIQELDIRGTKITGMNLPSSIRNLQVLKLPNSLTELTLNDAGMLHSLEFDEGVVLQSISMTNCNALTNVVNFDLLQTPSITLNNSYNNIAELYFRDTTNLSLSNMSNLERVIFTPNNEYETFELINVANAPDYKVTTFNCPKLSTFMTTAPYRESYNNGDYGNIQPNTTFTANSIDISNTQFTDVKLLCTTDTNILKLPTTVKNFYCDSSFDLDTNYLEDGEYDVVHGELVEPYTTDYEGKVERVKPITEVIPLIAGNFNNIVPSISWGDHYTDKLYAVGEYSIVDPGSITWFKIFGFDDADTVIWQYGGGSTADKTGFNGVIPDDVSYIRIGCVTSDTTLALVYDKKYPPNLVPSSADGSLIFSMYAPSNTVAPASGTWDLHGLEFDNFHTFGMNNDVKIVYPDVDELIINYHRDSQGYYYTCMIPTNATKANSGQINFRFYDKEGNDITHDKTCYYTLYDENMNYLDGDNTAGGSYVSLWISSNTKIVKYVQLSQRRNSIEPIYKVIVTDAGSPRKQTTYYTGVVTSSFKELPYEKDNTAYPITMPARYDDYNITIKNAYIKPTTHNTMLYPLLVNEDNPITGTLDYTNYAGKHLSWSFAYTDEEYVNIIQPKDELLNSYEYSYNTFYDTEYEFVNPYEVARYTSSASGVLPSFNTEFTYTYDEIDNGDGTYTTTVYADSLDNLPTLINFIGKPIISVDKLNTSQATNLQGLFQSCSKLERVDTRYWNTSKVTTMKQAFYGCQSLTSLDLSNLDMSSVKDITSMFQYCGIESIDLTDWDVSKVTDMSNLFCGAKVKTVDFTGWDTSSVTNMQNLFYECSTIETIIGMEDFDTSNATNISGMFFYTMNIKHNIDFSRWVITKNKSLYRMFRQSAFTDLSSISDWDTSSVTEMINTFYNCKCTSLDLSKWDTSNVTSMNGMFESCSRLTSLDLSGFDTSNVVDMTNMFKNCSGLTSLDLSNFKTSNVTTMNGMFYGCSSLTSLDLSGLKTSNVTNMGSMFSGCSSLTSLDLSGFDTSKVTSMSYMFSGCSSLTSLDLSGFDTSKVTSMSYMFSVCGKLTSLDLSNFKTSKVTSMSSMFSGCGKLTSLDLSGFDTSKVTNMVYMFNGCSSLTSLDSMQNISISLDVSYTILDVISLLDVINNLATVSTGKVLTLGETLIAKLTEEQIAIATNKGWNIS